MSVLSQIIPVDHFVDIDKLILKFIWMCKGSGIYKTILKKNKVGRVTLPYFKSYSNAVVIEIVQEQNYDQRMGQ